MKEILWSILKILGFVLILPLIIASVIAFQGQVLSLPMNKEVWLLWGAGIYIALHLFVYDFKDLYNLGNALIGKVISFKPVGYVLPLFTVLVIMVYVITLIFGKFSWQPYFLFAIAFTLAMHVVLTAREIYQADNTILKAHYLLVFGAVFVVSILIISLLLAWAIPEFSIVGFVKSLSSHTIHFYKSVYTALFVDSAI